MRCPLSSGQWTFWGLIQRKHWKVCLCYALLYLLTFGAVAPYLLSSWVYSFYFNETLFSKTAEAALKESNGRRLEKAHQYLNYLDPKESQDFHRKRLAVNVLDVLVVVKTIDRSVINDNPKVGYLTQTVVKLDREIRMESRGNLAVGLIVCNADPQPSLYEEAMSLARFYPTVTLEPRARSSVMRETEKQDYVRCLESIQFNSTQNSTGGKPMPYGRGDRTQFQEFESVLKMPPRYVLVVEDDAEPYDEMLPHLSWIVRNHIETRLERGEKHPNMESWAFLKLYYPERWSGYSNSITHILELCGIYCISGFVCASVVMLTCSPKGLSIQALRAHFFFGGVYGLLLALLVGRQHLLQLRRLVPGLVTVGSAPGCCTPATLYPYHIVDRIVRFLSNVTCTSEYGVDLALDDFARNNYLARYFVEPNLFHHRGVFSTLTKPKGMAEFLFDA